jgi:hypothetical protein
MSQGNTAATIEAQEKEKEALGLLYDSLGGVVEGLHKIEHGHLAAAKVEMVQRIVRCLIMGLPIDLM